MDAAAAGLASAQSGKPVASRQPRRHANGNQPATGPHSFAHTGGRSDRPATRRLPMGTLFAFAFVVSTTIMVIGVLALGYLHWQDERAENPGPAE